MGKILDKGKGGFNEPIKGRVCKKKIDWEHGPGTGGLKGFWGGKTPATHFKNRCRSASGKRKRGKGKKRGAGERSCRARNQPRGQNGDPERKQVEQCI